MYVYELGVIEKHGTGDTNDVFVCEHRGDMNRLAARMNELTAENAKLREQLAILIEGGQVADELIMMLHGIATHTANSPKVTPPGQDAARQMLAKIAAYHEKYT